jgi:hypothetical protein
MIADALAPARRGRGRMTADDRIGICLDCKRNCYDLGDYYMVHDAVWAASGGGEGQLCIDCLEGRIGRRLTFYDFRLTEGIANRRRWGEHDRMLPDAWRDNRQGLLL